MCTQGGVPMQGSTRASLASSDFLASRASLRLPWARATCPVLHYPGPGYPALYYPVLGYPVRATCLYYLVYTTRARAALPYLVYTTRARATLPCCTIRYYPGPGYPAQSTTPPWATLPYPALCTSSCSWATRARS